MTLIALALSLSPASAGDLSDGPDDDCCAKCDCTPSIDDLTSNDYGGYVNELESMIDQLQTYAPVGQSDAGWSVAGIVQPNGGGFDKTADLWTEQAVDQKGKLVPGHYIEHWFLDHDDLLDQPGAPFNVSWQYDLEWEDMAVELMLDGDYLDETYMKMDIHYVIPPIAIETAALLYKGDSVQAFDFEGRLEEDNNTGEAVAHLRREVHYDAAGAIVGQYEHWLFVSSGKGSFELLNDAGVTLKLTNVPTAATTRDFYLAFQGTQSGIGHASVISYTPTTTEESGLFFNVGLGN